MYLANAEATVPVDSHNKEELAYYVLSENLEDRFPGGAKTLGQIYLGVTRRLGLTKPESNQLVKRAVQGGYILKL